MLSYRYCRLFSEDVDTMKKSSRTARSVIQSVRIYNGYNADQSVSPDLVY